MSGARAAMGGGAGSSTPSASPPRPTLPHPIPPHPPPLNPTHLDDGRGHDLPLHAGHHLSDLERRAIALVGVLESQVLGWGCRQRRAVSEDAGARAPPRPLRLRRPAPAASSAGGGGLQPPTTAAHAAARTPPQLLLGRAGRCGACTPLSCSHRPHPHPHPPPKALACRLTSYPSLKGPLSRSTPTRPVLSEMLRPNWGGGNGGGRGARGLRDAAAAAAAAPGARGLARAPLPLRGGPRGRHPPRRGGPGATGRPARAPGGGGGGAGAPARGAPARSSGASRRAP
jgi:hypothetical protein